MPGFYPTTRPTLLAQATSGDRETRTRALGLLIAVYWRPVYRHLRSRRYAPDDAQDLTQSFFTHLLETEAWNSYDPSRGRLHAWLRSTLDHFAMNHQIAERRLKRGGGHLLASLDFADVEAAIARDPTLEDPETEFHQEWIRSFHTLALNRLRDECAATHPHRFELWYAYDVEESAPTYAALAERHGLTITKVTNELNAARRAFRRILLDTLRDVTATDREFRAEARTLLGIELS